MNDGVTCIVFIVILILLDRMKVVVALTWLVRGVTISLLKIRRTQRVQPMMMRLNATNTCTSMILSTTSRWRLIIVHQASTPKDFSTQSTWLSTRDICICVLNVSICKTAKHVLLSLVLNVLLLLLH